ncbi:MAG: Bud site selection protein bud4 [Watsoniomyces obsoletus]|nr:MAG: Bud site selection protein bud4 [Watsoniomyces obsoletus]
MATHDPSQVSLNMDLQNSIWSEDESASERQLPPNRVLHRHAKSVTFDAGPPQINEYEMTTPELSSVGTGSRESSYGSCDEVNGYTHDNNAFAREDSFDSRLENAEETPVVGPEDWSHLSPATAPDILSRHFEDPFGPEDDSMMPLGASTPNAMNGGQSPVSQSTSKGASPDRRPLPPVPGMGRARSHSNSSLGLSGVADRSESAQRQLPNVPAPASTSKSDILKISGKIMSLDERFRLLMLQEGVGDLTRVHSQRESLLKPARSEPGEDSRLGSQAPQSPSNVQAAQQPTEDASETPQRPRISRESILRKVKVQSQVMDDIDFSFASAIDSSTLDSAQTVTYDPDVPIPSTETDSIYEEADTSIHVKQEYEGEVDMSGIPDFQRIPVQEPGEETMLGESSVIHHQIPLADDESAYSRDSLGNETGVQHDDHTLTQSELPQLDSIPAPPPTQHQDMNESHRMSLPQFSSLLGKDDLDFGLQSFMSPSPKLAPLHPKENVPEPMPLQPTEQISEEKPARAIELERPVTPVEQLQPPTFPGNFEEGVEPQTPQSVIRHPIKELESSPELPTVPEPLATIKAPGGKLRARPSATPADLAEMAAVRRQVSGTHTNEVPPIPERHRDRPSLVQEAANETSKLSMMDGPSNAEPSNGSPRRKSVRKSFIKLDMPMPAMDEDLSMGLDKEFDRMLETQKVELEKSLSPASRHPVIANDRSIDLYSDFCDLSTQPGVTNGRRYMQRGYLMRQNTKMIVASSRTDENATTGVIERPAFNPRGSRSAGNSPRKPNQDRPQSWSVEPWNGKGRRKSVKDPQGGPRRKPVEGPVPPLPGQESNVARGLDSVAENQPPIVEEPTAPGEERGRLFVKVVGLKGLDLPMVKGQASWFNLTLDNGIHCVQTAWIELAKNAPIGQEFELVVLDDLEFTLTLQTEPPQPPAEPVPTPSPTKSVKTTKQSAFSRLLASPKKRREQDRKQQEEEQRAARQRQQDAQSRRNTVQPTAWDLLHKLVAQDGTFARAYISSTEHETRAYGRPYTLEVDCFNEWATETAATGSSVKSKRGDVQRRPPYRIGKLELQLLFVPKPKGATDDDMPKSLNACIRELKEAEVNASRQWEGHLSQQGGDCPYWRRRFFKLDGSKLTAYHETTRQPRATINLAKASKLIDDRSALLQKDVSSKGGNRRKSAFAEEEEGYMFVEEGFRIRFGNGEIIDFYADSAAAKDDWMKVLAEVVGKDTSSRKTWTDLVLARERAAGPTTGVAGNNNTNGNGNSNGSPQKPKTQQHARQPSDTTNNNNKVRGRQALAPTSPTRQAPVPPPIEKSPRHHQHSNSSDATSPAKPRGSNRVQNPPRSMIW